MTFQAERALQVAYLAGREACRTGKPLGANPYPAGWRYAIEWTRGWLHEKAGR